jgi:glycerol dehydrogenase-like iron-containing ADH family enzyme
VILNNIISTGLAALLGGEAYNAAAAHGLFYGMTLLKEVEENRLHGEVVAYGILVMLMMDNDTKEIEKLHPFYREMGWPTRLADLHLTEADISDALIEKALSSAVMNRMPYAVTGEMLKDAISRLDGSE